MIKPITTKDSSGKANGWLLPIWNATMEAYRPEQIYMTVVDVACSKGPHLHMKRAGRFLCIKGNVRIVTKQWTTYAEHTSGDVQGFNVINVPPGIPAQIINIGNEPAYVLNMPTPAWTAEDPDDAEVVGWEY